MQYPTKRLDVWKVVLIVSINAALCSCIVIGALRVFT
jgi:hypothetical protein